MPGGGAGSVPGRQDKVPPPSTSSRYPNIYRFLRGSPVKSEDIELAYVATS